MAYEEDRTSAGGSEAPGYATPAAGVEQKTSGKAIASLVCAVVGLIIAGIILGIIAVILGIVTKREIDANPGPQRGRIGHRGHRGGSDRLRAGHRGPGHHRADVLRGLGPRGQLTVAGRSGPQALFLPGLSRPLGSRAALIARWAPTAAGAHCRRS